MVIESQTMTVNCGIGSGEVTIIGSGFGIAPPEGSELYMNVMQNNVKLDIVIWTDTKIIATGGFFDGSEITVNGLFDSATK